jgi:hypothetical protein
MSANWRKLGLFLVGVAGLYILLIGVTADFAQVASLRYGIPLLVLLFIVVLGYKGWEEIRKLWNHYCSLRTRLDEVRDFILRGGEHSTIILLCTQARWLFQQHEQSIRVSEFQADGVVVLDVSQVSLRPDDSLLGIHFAIIGFDGGERAKGTVKQCDPAKACIELYEQKEEPCVGDLAIPIEPPQATELESLLGNILFIVTQ